MTFLTTVIHQIDAAVDCLQRDDVVAIPTETVYGLAGNAESDVAIKKIFSMKNRPLSHPLIMHIAEGADIRQWVEYVPDYALKLMEAYWPGPLTLVFQGKPGKINPLVTGGQSTVAIRCPQHPMAQALLQRLAFPLVAPSANPFGKISPTTAEHVQQSFPDHDLLILDGGRCRVGIESSIVSAVDPGNYQILRHGVIDEQAICYVLNSQASTGENDLRVPGKMDSHYQPEKPLYCFDSLESLQIFCQRHPDAYVLSFHKDSHFNYQAGFQLPDNPGQLAYELYYQLRQADQSDASLIAMELPPGQAGWEGIIERVLKASTR